MNFKLNNALFNLMQRTKMNYGTCLLIENVRPAVLQKIATACSTQKTFHNSIQGK